MSYPLQLTYGGVALHSLGTVSVLSQSGEFSPNEFPQVETRTLRVRVDTWEPEVGYNYDTLYASIKSLREACQAQNKILKWQSGGDSALGEVQLQRPAMVVSHDLPEEPNARGVFNQQINIVFRFEVDTSADSTTLTATVKGHPTGGTYQPFNMGKVHKWKDEYRNAFYSEWQNIRQRSTGSVTCSGEIRLDTGETGVTTDTRLAQSLSTLTTLKTHLQAGRYITLTYGSAGSVFNRDVKIESFTADIDQGPLVGVIKWSLSCSYTLFPNEAGYAGSEFSASLSRDAESGREVLSLSGTVRAATEALAVSKLAVIEATMQTAYGFAAGQQNRRDITKNWVNADDTQSLNSTNDGATVARTSFIDLTFNLGYEKKISGVTSYSLTVTDSDDLESGLITRTYAGSVTATGASEEAAYNTAVTLARTLGDKRHSFRVNKTETRADRKLTTGSQEFLRVDFSYSYRLKGERMYLSVTSSTSEDTFGETQERIQGYVVAKDLTTARDYYQTLVRDTYEGRLIRNETLDERGDYVQLGTTWTTAAGGQAYMPIRLDFSLSVFKAKTTGTHAIKYVVNVVPDYLALSQTTSVRGTFVGDPTYLTAIEAGTSNPLDTFITNIGSTYGNLVRKSLDYDRELVNSSVLADATTITIPFSLEYTKSITTEAQILRCQLREDIQYSGTRWIEQPTPDSTIASVVQDCGKTCGSRTVTGSITAATESAALAWAERQHGDSGIWENWRSGETKPGDDSRYEQPMRISIAYDFAPLTDGSARGGGANIQVVNLEFTYTELVPDLPAPF